MAETHPIRLSQNEVNERARKYFGPHGAGMRLTTEEPELLRFESDTGFVQLRARQNSNNQVRLTIDHQGHHDEIRGFRRLLARQAVSETRE
jgi:hypothetical protein